MDRQEIIERVNGIIIKTLGVEKDAVKESASFDSDLYADSLDHVEIVMGVERSFGISITDKEAETLRTVGDIYDFVEKKCVI